MRRTKDSGSSGNDRDRSSGSRRSESRKSDRIARKPSKELLKIQNFTDSSEDDNRLSSNKDSLLKRSSFNKFSDSRSFHEQLSSFERKEEMLTGFSIMYTVGVSQIIKEPSSCKMAHLNKDSIESN